jgi:hypothetical protein
LVSSPPRAAEVALNLRMAPPKVALDESCWIDMLGVLVRKIVKCRKERDVAPSNRREAFPPLLSRMSFAELKAKRATKTPSAISSVVEPIRTVGNEGEEIGLKSGQPGALLLLAMRALQCSLTSPAAPSPTQSSSAVPYAHPDLPSSLEVRQLPGRGRGVVAKERIAAGTLLLDLFSPLLSTDSSS